MTYDLAIIGGGPAGYSAAYKAAELGVSAIMIERGQIGGACLNRGCIPTKFLAHTAELFSQARNSDNYGITTSNVDIDYSLTLRRKNTIIDQLRANITKTLTQKKITLIYGDAFIPRLGTVQVNGEQINAANILIATGSRPARPLIDDAISSDGLLELDYIPKSLKIIGGGVAAVEFAYIYNRMGSDVTMCLRSERILRRWDKEIAVGLTQNFKKHGIDILPNCDRKQMNMISADITLSATGREMSFDGLFAGSLDIAAGDNGIAVNDYGCTNIPHIYAAGDVVANSAQLAHVAMAQGERVSEHIAGLPPKPFPAVVSCIYTSPEIAQAGLTEIEARNQGIAAVTGKYTMSANARTVIITMDRGFMKLVADKSTERIIGAQLMCERASDIIGELALAINARLTIPVLARSLRAHPTFAEGITVAAERLLEKLK